MCFRRAMRRIPEREPTAPPTAGPSYSTAVAVTRASHCGPDPFYDPIGFVLSDFDELVLQIATLGGDQGRSCAPRRDLW